MQAGRVLVSGGAGVVGSHVVDQLVKGGAGEVVVLDNFSRGRAENLSWAMANGPVQVVEGDIRQRRPLGAFTWLEGRRLLVHLAGPAQDAPRYESPVPGRVVAVSTGRGHVDVLTGDGVLRLHQVEADGTGQVAAATLVRSVKTTLGLCTADLLRRIEESEARLAALDAATGNRPGGGAP